MMTLSSSLFAVLPYNMGYLSVTAYANYADVSNTNETEYDFGEFGMINANFSICYDIVTSFPNSELGDINKRYNAVHVYFNYYECANCDFLKTYNFDRELGDGNHRVENDIPISFPRNSYRVTHLLLKANAYSKPTFPHSALSMLQLRW